MRFSSIPISFLAVFLPDMTANRAFSTMLPSINGRTLHIRISHQLAILILYLGRLIISWPSVFEYPATFTGLPVVECTFT